MHDATLASIDGCFQLCSRVNDFLAFQQMLAFYQVQIVGAHKKVSLNNGLYAIQCHKLMADADKTDLIIIPIICGNFPDMIEKNKWFKHWIVEQK